MDNALIVKRLSVNPMTKRVTIASDNPAYATWPDCKPAGMNVIGRVVRAARKIS